MPDTLVRRLGFPGLVLHSDSLATDRVLWVRRQLPRDLAGTRVLDAGCGNGTMAMLAARRGAEVLALSDTQQELADARRRAKLLGLADKVTFEVQDLRTLSSRTDLGTFDVIMCLEVIEHLLDDLDLIRALADLGHEGTLLLLSTPTDDHPPVYGEERHLSGVEDGRHVRWGSSAERLHGLCRDGGWNLDRLEPVSGPLSRRVSSLAYRIGERSVVAGWATTLPLRFVSVVDPVVLRGTAAKSHCWGLRATRS